MTVKAMKGGAVEFLAKPVREQDLLDAVRIALDRDRARREENAKSRHLRERYNALSTREQQVMALGLRRHDEQADCRRTRDQRDHREGASSQRDEETWSEDASGFGQNDGLTRVNGIAL